MLGVKENNHMNTKKVNYEYTGTRFLRLITLLITLYIPCVVFAETKDNSVSSVDTVNTLHPEHINILKENTNTLQKVATQLEGIRQTIDGKLSDIGRNTNISSDINNLNQSLAKLPNAIRRCIAWYF